MTHRIEPLFMNLFSIWLPELKSFSFWLKELNLACFSIWLKELNLFLNITQRIELFLNMTQKNCTFLFLEYDTKNWIFFYMIQRIEPFFSKGSKKFTYHDSKNWTFFTWLKELNLFLNMTQRIEPCFKRWLKELNFKKLIQRINFFFWRNDWKNWTFLINTTLKIRLKKLNFFSIWLKDFENDSKNRTHFWMQLRKLNSFVEKHSKKWNFLKKKKKTKNQPILKNDSKNWTFFVWKWMTQRREPSSKMMSLLSRGRKRERPRDGDITHSIRGQFAQV